MKYWTTKRLSEFAHTVSTGPFGSILHKSDYISHGIPIVNPINIFDGHIVPDPNKQIGELTAKRLQSYRLMRGDIVVGRRGEIGRCAVVQGEQEGWICGTGCFFIRPLPSMNPHFLAYLLKTTSYREKLERLSTGATMKNLSNSALGELSVSVPPLPEQQRIVAILDEAFEAIATAKANININLESLNTSIESFLDSIFKQNSDKWTTKKLIDYSLLVSTGPFGSILHKSDYVNFGVPLVNPINIVDGRIVPNPNKLIDENTRQRLRSYILQEGDIVVGRRGEIGRCAVVGRAESGWVCGTGCFFIRPNQSLEPHFLAHLIRSPIYRKKLELLSKGATMKNLSNSSLSDLYVAAPPVDIQVKIIQSIEEFSAQIEHLGDIYRAKLTSITKLQQSLLHHAFTGNL
jgi:type I restriction enzyme S subunit